MLHNPKSKARSTTVHRRGVLAGIGLLAGATAFASATLIDVPAAHADDIAGKFKASGSGTLDHSAWTAFLKRYVKPSDSGLNEVDYKAFKAEGRAPLTAYIKMLEQTDVTALNSKEQFAYWANLYNAKTIDIVLDHYPVETIRDIDISGFFSNGPWDKKVVSVKNTQLSLNDIEHTIMRGHFKDPRVHYAVNCASIGCPNLGTEAFTGPELEEQLNAAARKYVNSPRGFRIADGDLRASKIYSWFQEDFGGSEAGVIKHAAKYADPALAAELKARDDIDGFDYDWSLNDTNM